jgi:hypothetical protein
MDEPHQRLREARREAGFESPTEAAHAFRWNPVTYLAHENGTRGLRPSVAERYARAYNVPVEWLLFGRGHAHEPATDHKVVTVPLVGYVGAGATAYFFSDQGEFDHIAPPEFAGPHTVAVEIRGESLGAFFDRWLVFYDDVRRPITPDLIGRLCVVGLEDGRVLIKKVQRSRTKGLFHLLSQTEQPILDVAVEWAAKVKNMVPR